jgi:tRNA(Arg) A34 adenosine deaminase TadA
MNGREALMQIAIAEARKGMSKGNRPFGAIIIKDGAVVVRSHSTTNSDSDVTAHAELSAVRKFSRKARTLDLKGGTMFATGEPCLMCCAAIATANLSELVIAASHADIPARMRTGRKRRGLIGYQELFSEYGVRVKTTKGVLKDEVVKLYKEWLKNHAP